MKHSILFFLAICVGLMTHAQVPSYVPTDGLVAWYPLDGMLDNSVSDEFDGLSFNGNFIPNRFDEENGAAGLPGNHLLELPLNPALLSNDFSISFWVFKRANSVHNPIQIWADGGPGRVNFGFNALATNGAPFMNEGNCSGGYGDCGITDETTATPSNEWIHFVYVVKGDDSQIFLNGNELTLQKNCTLHLDCEDESMSLWFGGDVGGGATEYFNGDFDDIGIWHGALTPQEIWSIYAGIPLDLGCTEESACNYDFNANSDDGSCIPSGCMDPDACNYNDLAQCEGEACDYSCPDIPDYVPTNGLVAWFPFNGNANDESMNGHDANVDGATLSADRYGTLQSAYSFDGNDRIFPSNPSDWPMTERTTSIWMKSDVPVSGGRTLFGYGGTSCGNSWLVTYNNQGNYPLTQNAFEVQGHCNNLPTAAPMDATEITNWHHVAIRTDPSGTTVFIDGLPSGSSDIFINNTTPGCAVIGATPSPSGDCVYADNNNELWEGRLDDFGIWDRALSDEEILLLYLSDVETGCTDSNACNFDAAATIDDGSCEYGCTYCGPGTSWDADAQICVVTTSPYLNEPGEAAVINPCYFDSDRSGLVEVTDLMNLLSVYGMSCFWECGDLVNHQGHDYATVQIGEQCWFAENLSYIPNGESALNEGNVSTSAAYTPVGNEDAQIYYNHFAALEWDLCPTGWHVPSLEDWEMGIAEYETGSLEVFDADGWSITLDGYWDGSVLQAGAQATLWSTDIRPEDGWGMFQNFISSGNQYSGGAGRDSGATIRCVQD